MGCNQNQENRVSWSKKCKHRENKLQQELDTAVFGNKAKVRIFDKDKVTIGFGSEAKTYKTYKVVIWTSAPKPIELLYHNFIAKGTFGVVWQYRTQNKQVSYAIKETNEAEEKVIDKLSNNGCNMITSRWIGINRKTGTRMIIMPVMDGDFRLLRRELEKMYTPLPLPREFYQKVHSLCKIVAKQVLCAARYTKVPYADMKLGNVLYRVCPETCDIEVYVADLGSLLLDVEGCVTATFPPPRELQVPSGAHRGQKYRRRDASIADFLGNWHALFVVCGRRPCAEVLLLERNSRLDQCRPSTGS